MREIWSAPGPLGRTSDILIPAGSTAQVAHVLGAAGAIRHEAVFRAASWLTRGQGPLHAGEFLLPARASLREIFGILRHGAPVEHRVTIPEGLTGAQIAAILNAAPVATGHVAAPAEGAVLPQTYDYLWGESRQAILARAEAALGPALDAAWAKRDKNVPLASPRQAMILASIVQQESPLDSELPEIAAVYENRLRKGMRLQADPTVIFAATGEKSSGGQTITRGDLANPSPYNTYVHAGLPPGPICAPGLAAIQAVLHPAASDALYFVATGHGGHVFADDFQQHQRNVARYRAAKN